MSTLETMEAGKDMDVLVAERVMGESLDCDHPAVEVVQGSLVRCVFCKEEHGSTSLAISRAMNSPAPYSTDIAAAWRVVERLRGLGFGVDIHANGTNHPEVFSQEYEVMMGFDAESVRADTAPLAICRAALAAVTP